MVWDEGGTYVQTDAVFAHNDDARVEPRASARSSAPCSPRACG